MGMNNGRIETTLSAMVLLVAVAMVIAGCGRTSLESDCTSDDDCDPGLHCQDNSCVTQDPAQGLTECSSDMDCGDGYCYEMGDQCRVEFCNEATGYCDIRSCEPGCAEDERQVDCRCIPETCSDDDECQGQVCRDGLCRPCASDSECSDFGTEICNDGFCEPNAECEVDGDCRTYEMCRNEQCVRRPDCTFDDDCEVDERCVGGTCTYTPDCESDDDCTSQAECVGGQCQAAMCRGNDECSDGQLCDAGDCVDPPVALSCEIVTDSQAITAGQSVPLQAFAYDDQGNGVAASFSWTSSDSAVASIDGDELVGGAAAGQTTVTATLDGGDPVVCAGEPTFENLGPVADDELRVGVVHMETGEPIEGADVYVDDTSQSTDANGYAEFADPGGAYDVSVFHDDYDYLTVQQASSDDIRVPISPKSGTGPVAGFTGQFDMAAIQSDGDIEMGIAGASLAGDLLDLDLGQLLGDPFYTEFDVPGFGGGGGGDVPIPGALTVSGNILGMQVDGKQTYYAQSAGGPRLTWGIGGKVDFSELLGVISDPPTDIGSAIGTFLPLFSRFDHAQQPEVLDALPRVLDIQDIDNDGITDEWLPDYDNFPQQDLMPSVRQDLTTDVDIATLPSFDGQQGEVAVLLGGTRAEAMGMVPLGISAVSDEGGQPDSRTLYMAPPYGSAVGGRYAVLALAFPQDIGGEGGLSGDYSMALWNGQTLQSDIALGTFPDSSQGSIDESQRQVQIDVASAGPIFRIRMVDEERSWDVWTAGEQTVAGQFSDVVHVETPPAGRSDLFGDGEELYVDAVNTSVSIDDLVRADGVGLHRVGLVTTRFNRTAFD